MVHKSGFVNIIGNPNVGKSTLMNAMVGDHMSIITPKVQTTRQRIIGIVNGPDYQIVFSDTPGILDPKYRLQDAMVKAVSTALIDADVILLVTDPKDSKIKNTRILSRLRKTRIPILLLMNKIDQTGQELVKKAMKDWDNWLPEAEQLVISALQGTNLDVLLGKILDRLPEGPPYYPEDQLTDRTERFFVAEMIREKILLYYQQEIPYAVQVEVEQFKEDHHLIRISARIFVGRESQKRILIGHKGQALKKVGVEARKDIESFFNKKVFLELFVKVQKDWRDNERQLKKWGYL
jgi:GTP-binding protein Era